MENNSYSVALWEIMRTHKHDGTTSPLLPLPGVLIAKNTATSGSSLTMQFPPMFSGKAIIRYKNSSSGNITIRFNNDSGSNYNFNGSAITSGGSVTGLSSSTSNDTSFLIGSGKSTASSIAVVNFNFAPGMTFASVEAKSSTNESGNQYNYNVFGYYNTTVPINYITIIGATSFTDLAIYILN